jgi:hypothetical protein
LTLIEQNGKSDNSYLNYMAKELTSLEQYQALLNQAEKFKTAAIEEAKTAVTEARKVLAEKEAFLRSLTGETSLAKAKGERKARAKSVTDAELKPEILKVMAAHGLKGLNATEIGAQIGQAALRVNKFIANNSGLFKKTGEKRSTKYFLK